MRWLAVVVGGILALVSVGVLYVVSEASWGWIAALVAVLLAVMVMPAVLGMLPLRDEDAWAPSAGARKWSRAVVATAGFMLVLFVATARISVSDALNQLPGRHPGLGALGRAAARVGRVLGPRH